MSKLGVFFAIVLVFGFVGFSLVVASIPKSTNAPEPPRLVSMAESADAMQQAVNAMLTHGDAMLTEGRHTDNQDLTTHGEHWLRDAQSLMRNAQMLGVNLAAPENLHATPSELAAQGNWGELNRNAQAMLHDPSTARTIDIEALRWNGLSMQSEGQNMTDHGKIMVEEVDVMIARHGLTPQAASDLRQAAQTMRDIGGSLARNGQRMVDYADQMRRMVGR